MKEKLLRNIEQHYDKIKFEMSINDTIDWLKFKNNDKFISLYTVKDGNILITTVDGNEEIDFGPHGFQLKRSLLTILEKYPNFEIKFLFWKYDNLIPDVYNYPIFCVANVPSESVYNPLGFYDYLKEIPQLIERAYIQIPFEHKKKIAYASTGLSGIYGHLLTKQNWINHYKIKFSLLSLLFPDKCDYKMFFPNESQAMTHFGEMKDAITNLSLFSQRYDQLDINELWNAQLNVQINLVSEGNSSISQGRLLQSLYNNGHIIRIGPIYNIGLIEMMINACDYKLFDAVCFDADSHFLKSVDSLIDYSFNLEERRKFVVNHFSHDYLIDVMYEIYKLYMERIKL